MLTEADFLRAIVADPTNAPSTWLILADWLEEQGDPRYELVRLQHLPQEQSPLGPRERDERIRELLAAGMRPVVPHLTNSIGMELVLIPAGKFLMGSPVSETDRSQDEGPQHEVAITQPFWLGKYQVTQQEYQEVMGENPSFFSGEGNNKERVRDLDTRRLPVLSVSWEEAMGFCRRLSKRPKEQAENCVSGLPTEAQWEYACRGGARSYFVFHSGDTLSIGQANFQSDAEKDRSLDRTTLVGSYKENAFGLCDMHGNVLEWCADRYSATIYSLEPRTDPTGSETGFTHVLRGGSWNYSKRKCRSANRSHFDSWHHSYSVGFRVVVPLAP